MGIKLGNTGIGALYLGNTKIVAAYKGSVKVFESSTTPYLIFRFTDPYFTPTVGSSSSDTARHGTWTSLGNGDWKWSCAPYQTSTSGGVDPLSGWKIAFSSEDSTPVGRLVSANIGYGSVSIIGYGGNLASIETIDRMFANCTGITSFVDIPFTSLANSSGTFKGCTQVTSGALDMYTSLSSLAVPPANHSDMFTDCGTLTGSGTAELNQIPVGWGGNYAPVTVYSLSLARDSASYSWMVTANSGSLDFSSTSLSVNIYTTSSMSQYSGINMRKSNVRWYNGSGPGTGSQYYYYPCFFQCSSLGPNPGAMTWLAISETYNGTLTGSQTAGDMPGTLDYNSFGAIKYIDGTFDRTQYPYFGFFVTILNPTLLWNGYPLNTYWGLLYNSYFKSATTINYL